MIKKLLAAALVLCAFIESGFAQPPAIEAAAPNSKTRAPQSNLPNCKNSQADIAKIHAAQKANSRSSHKYDGYRDVLQADISIELATRLAYAETLAAHCTERNDQIAELVASIIGNRVRIRRGDIESVVFQKDQFASSLNIYPESRYRNFLCPTDGELWNKTLAKMRANLEASSPSAPIPKDTVNYYLYRHSNRLKAPDWKLAEVRINDEKTRECIRVFRDPGWK